MARRKIECCHNCPKRKPECHSTCEDYKTQKAELEETMASVRKQNMLRCALNDHVTESIKRTNRRCNKKGW